jgi:hypothetical protein
MMAQVFLVTVTTCLLSATLTAALDHEKECPTLRSSKEFVGMEEHVSLKAISVHDTTRQLNLTKQLTRNKGVEIYDCCNQLAAQCIGSGVYTGRVNEAPTKMFCDMNGGWTVIQRRKDGSQDFFQNWETYARGFGDVNGEFWLGNDKIAALTNSGLVYELRIDMEDFSGLKKYAQYSNFKIGFADEKYKLKSLGEFSGSTVDSFTSYHLYQSFSTYDQDNDEGYSNCGESYKSGWWFNNCHYVNLNKPWINKVNDGIRWENYKNNNDGHKTSLKSTTMKIRPTECDI